MTTPMHSRPPTPTTDSSEATGEGVLAPRSTSDQFLLRLAAVAIPVGSFCRS
ncbi:MAG: hypothetical protein K0S98_261 [Propionibacteriaceae bacterium]|nr:hypothetical protein [Propionibacteriaceae bacterium]